MATTGGIWSPDDSDKFDPPTDLGVMAASIAARIEELSPLGMVSAYAGSTAPSGWLFCRGQAVSRSTYAGLFNAIGTTYGGGDGSSTFNLPDLRGRVVSGLNAGSQYDPSLGHRDGANSRGLSTANMPAHSHRIVGGESGTARLRSARGRIAAHTGTRWAPWFGGGYSGADNVRTTTVGSGSAFMIRQPYLVLNYIIKA